jgi:hypothetical protein
MGDVTLNRIYKKKIKIFFSLMKLITLYYVFARSQPTKQNVNIHAKHGYL